MTVRLQSTLDLPGPRGPSGGSILTVAVAPTVADIPAGTFRVCKSTTTGRLTVWANDGGTLVDLLSLPVVA